MFLVLVFRKFYLVVAAANGVVIATEKKLPSILVDETSVSEQLLFFIDWKLSCALIYSVGIS